MSIFKMLIHSFNSIEAYKYAIYNWKFKMFLYFILISLISAFAIMIQAYASTNEFFDKQMDNIIEQIQDIEIVNYQVKTPNNQSIDIKDNSGEVFAVISPDLLDANKLNDILFAIEKDRLSLFIKENSENNIPLENIVDSSESVSLESLLPSKGMFQAIVLIAIPIVSIVMNAFYVVIMAMANFILSMTILPSFGFIRALKLACLTITPALLVDSLSIIVFSTQIPAFLFAGSSAVIAWYVLKKISLNEVK